MSHFLLSHCVSYGVVTFISVPSQWCWCLCFYSNSILIYLCDLFLSFCFSTPVQIIFIFMLSSGLAAFLPLLLSMRCWWTLSGMSLLYLNRPCCDQVPASCWSSRILPPCVLWTHLFFKWKLLLINSFSDKLLIRWWRVRCSQTADCCWKSFLIVLLISGYWLWDWRMIELSSS